MTECLSDEIVVELISGLLPERARADALQHVDRCPRCLELVGAAGRDDAIAPPPGRIERGASLGRYVVLERVGAGAMGIVYAAFDTELDRKVALKVLRGSGDATLLRARLQREAKVMARLNHPNVAAVYDVGERDGRVFVAMEFADGGSLRAWMREGARHPIDVLRVFREAGEGLAAAHAAGLVHGDFKPENVLLGKDGRARVTDFGLAREAGESDEPGARGGTLAYMAPEQIEGRSGDARSDVYAFATALYEALYGTRPFGDRTTEEAKKAAASIAFPAPPRGTRVPAWIRRVVLRGLAGNADERTRSMREMLDALARAPRSRSLSVAAAVFVAMVITAGLVARRYALAGACTGGIAAFGDAWGDAEREATRRTLEREGDRGRDAFAGFSREMSAFRDRWIDTWTDTCAATHVRREQSEALLDARMLCLDRARGAASSLVKHIAAGDPKAVDAAVEAAQSLMQPVSCRAELFSTRAAREQDPARQAKAKHIAEVVANVRPFEYLTRGEDVIPALESAAVSAKEIDDARLEAQARTELGTMHALTDDLGVGRTALLAAVEPALRAGDPGTLADVWTRLLWIEQRLGNAPVADAWATQADAAIKSAGGDEAREAERLALLATLRVFNQGRYDEGVDLAERARAAFEAQRGPDYFRLASCDDVIGEGLGSMGKLDDSLRAHERGLALRLRVFGPSHPVVETSRGNVAEAKLALGDPEPVIAIMTETIATRRARGQKEGAYVHHARAEAYRVARRYEEALADDRVAVTLGETGDGDGQLFWGLAGAGEDLLLLGRYDEAIAELERAQRVGGDLADRDAAIVEINLASALLGRGVEKDRARSIAARAEKRLAPLAQRYGSIYEKDRARAEHLATGR